MTSEAFQLARPAGGTLALSGVLGFGTAASALDALMHAMAEPYAVLDLAGVSRGDSAGLACLLAIQAEAARRGQTLKLAHLPEGLLALARVCGLESILG